MVVVSIHCCTAEELAKIVHAMQNGGPNATGDSLVAHWQSPLGQVLACASKSIHRVWEPDVSEAMALAYGLKLVHELCSWDVIAEARSDSSCNKAQPNKID
ncbi:hypothetical protein GH714_018302 [Hevea brasiliensis]|uniref:Uncharacterized protein n=1 Tax=Hevea brasiliensis TaxID=3981 RepID=A0A6A6K5G4_HEVBR|nr:hypothetical protein GH714_018302 [Hevea brasiliensis]